MDRKAQLLRRMSSRVVEVSCRRRGNFLRDYGGYGISKNSHFLNEGGYFLMIVLFLNL